MKHLKTLFLIASIIVMVSCGGPDEFEGPHISQEQYVQWPMPGSDAGADAQISDASESISLSFDNTSNVSTIPAPPQSKE